MMEHWCRFSFLFKCSCDLNSSQICGVQTLWRPVKIFHARLNKLCIYEPYFVYYDSGAEQVCPALLKCSFDKNEWLYAWFYVPFSCSRSWKKIIKGVSTKYFQSVEFDSFVLFITLVFNVTWSFRNLSDLVLTFVETMIHFVFWTLINRKFKITAFI